MTRDRPFQMRWSQGELDKLDNTLDDGQSRADFIRIAVAKAIAAKPCTRCKGSGEEPPRKARGKK